VNASDEVDGLDPTRALRARAVRAVAAHTPAPPDEARRGDPPAARIRGMTATPSERDPRVLHLPTGETITIVASGQDDGGAGFEIDALLPPGPAGPPRHRHRTETETFTVQEGRLQVVLGRDTRVLSAGDTVTVPPTVVHGFSNPFDEPARIRVRETPAGPLEEQFRALAGSGRIPPIGWLATIDVRHGLSFAVHGVPDPVQEPMWRLLAWTHSHVRLRRPTPARR
jgi:mannose-6-phosphate isomerase-like protein (cupin superfamily)